jgi:hypothetical protein
MSDNPTTEGPVKSLRQAAPGGDIVAAVFAVIALLVLVGLVRSPITAGGVLLSLFFIAVFAVPAYVLYSSSRSTGLFVSDSQVEYRTMGQPRQAWPRTEVGAIEPMSGGLKLMGTDGRVLRTYRFRWWSTEQVARFARAAGLAPVSPALLAEVDPGKAGDGRKEKQPGQ